MKSLLGACAFMFIALFVSACSVAPDAGQEAVLIEKPILFGHGGVIEQPVHAGLTFVALTTQVVYVSVLPQQFNEHFDDLMSSDGVPLDFDSVIRLQVTNTVETVKKFGINWYESNVKAEFQNRVRQSVRNHGMNETAISSKAIDQIDTEVTAAMEEYLIKAALPIKLIQITVGKANPPDSVKDQRIETATQEQRQLTEKQRKLAEDQRKEAEKSRAEADNAYRVAMQLTPDMFLRLEKIKMQEKACKVSTCTFIEGASATPVIPLK